MQMWHTVSDWETSSNAKHSASSRCHTIYSCCNYATQMCVTESGEPASCGTPRWRLAWESSLRYGFHAFLLNSFFLAAQLPDEDLLGWTARVAGENLGRHDDWR